MQAEIMTSKFWDNLQPCLKPTYYFFATLLNVYYLNIYEVVTYHKIIEVIQLICIFFANIG